MNLTLDTTLPFIVAVETFILIGGGIYMFTRESPAPKKPAVEVDKGLNLNVNSLNLVLKPKEGGTNTVDNNVLSSVPTQQQVPAPVASSVPVVQQQTTTTSNVPDQQQTSSVTPLGDLKFLGGSKTSHESPGSPNYKFVVAFKMPESADYAKAYYMESNKKVADENQDYEWQPCSEGLLNAPEHFSETYVKGKIEEMLRDKTLGTDFKHDNGKTYTLFSVNNAGFLRGSLVGDNPRPLINMIAEHQDGFFDKFKDANYEPFNLRLKAQLLVVEDLKKPEK